MKDSDFNKFLKPRLSNNSESFKIPEYDLEKGIERVLELIREKLLTQQEPIVVEIAGGSASGKTSAVAIRLKEVLGNSSFILSIDDYCYERAFMNARIEKGEPLNDDQPEALDLELFKSHLIKLKKGEAIKKPIFDLKESKRVGTVTIQPHKVVIVEGLFALNDLITKEGDVKIFVDTSTHGRLLRRLFRDIERTGKKPAETLKYFLEVIVQMHEKHVRSTKNNADLIIRNEYDPKVEAQKSGLQEVQLKFQGEIDMENLQRLGAERIISINQEDHYYPVNNSDLSETGEILRVRWENGKKLLTYKGPRVESDFQIRSKFEFEIDEKTETKLISAYGHPIKIIKKERALYELDGIVFSIDNVSKIEKGEEVNVGKFIEISSTTKDMNIQKIIDTILKLGFSIKDNIKKSYSEM